LRTTDYQLLLLLVVALRRAIINNFRADIWVMGSPLCIIYKPKTSARSQLVTKIGDRRQRSTLKGNHHSNRCFLHLLYRVSLAISSFSPSDHHRLCTPDVQTSSTSVPTFYNCFSQVFLHLSPPLPIIRFAFT
jgi:hypothetical protein